MAIIEFPPEITPNLEANSHLEFDTYRAKVDELNQILHPDGLPMPRTGIFDEEDYYRAVIHEDSVFDGDMPIAVPYYLAYPNANLDKYPNLVNAAYLMTPYSSLTVEQLDLLKASNFEQFIGEITVYGLVDYAQDWDNCIQGLNVLSSTIADRLPSISLANGMTVEALGNDGQPVIHHLMIINGDVQFNDTEFPSITDKIVSQGFIEDNLDSISKHHLDAFSDHSKTATLIHLDHKDELADMLTSPEWYVATHLDADQKIDGLAIATSNVTETPWINPQSIDTDGYFLYVDSVSTGEHARRKGVALQLLSFGLLRHHEFAKLQNKQNLYLPFDTAGESNDSVPTLAKAVFDLNRFQLVGGRVDAIAHVVLKR